jgi:hypothetical protein
MQSTCAASLLITQATGLLLTPWTDTFQPLVMASLLFHAGDMLLASGMIAYLGAFTAELRAEALAGWTQVRGG